MADDKRYYEFHEEQFKQWEAKCTRCGACCGVFDGDPCEHLRTNKNNAYYCSIYENRFGTHRTVNGREFKCVPIREILHTSWPGDECCGYKKNP